MSMKKMRQHNSQNFFDDLDYVGDVMVWCKETNCYLHVKKSQVKKMAERTAIRYHLDSHIFANGRDVMIIR